MAEEEALGKIVAKLVLYLWGSLAIKHFQKSYQQQETSYLVGVPSRAIILSIWSTGFSPLNSTVLPNSSPKMQPADQMSIALVQQVVNSTYGALYYLVTTQLIIQLLSEVLVIVLQSSCQVEISQFQGAVLIKKYVFWLEISVNDVAAMEIAQGMKYLEHDESDVFLIKLAGRVDKSLKVAAHELKYQIHIFEGLRILGNYQVYQRDYIAMFKECQQFNFPEDPLAVSRILEHIPGFLYRDALRVPRVCPRTDHSVGPGAYYALQRIIGWQCK